MRLPFQDWLDEYEIPETARSLFEEAISCYKAGAYRASMIMSYLGFQTVIRSRILAASLPPGMPGNLWASIQSALRDDDKWDDATFDAIARQQPTPVFLLTDDLRNQVSYYKYRRHDCAHGKSNAVSAPHVEAFWLFVTSNLPKFVVGGSEDALLDKIRGHFDASVTPPGQPFHHLVKEIGEAVYEVNLQSFFQKVVSTFDELEVEFAPLIPLNRDLYRFFQGVLEQGSPQVSRALVAFLSGRRELLTSLLRSIPTLVGHFAHEREFIRRLWHEELFGKGSQRSFPVFAAMLSQSVIPADERVEAIRHCIKSLKGELPEEFTLILFERLAFSSSFTS